MACPPLFPARISTWIVLWTLMATATAFLPSPMLSTGGTVKREHHPFVLLAHSRVRCSGGAAMGTHEATAKSLLQAPLAAGRSHMYMGALNAATLRMITEMDDSERSIGTPSRSASVEAPDPPQAQAPSERTPVWGLILPEVKNVRRPPLPRLSEGEMMRLLTGERIEKQERVGRVGTGIVAVDVEADVSTVMAVLTDIDRYVSRIPTMRKVNISRRGNQVVSAQFCISRFRLEINTDMRVDLERNMLEFRLDPLRPTLALQEARGFWFVEKAEGRPAGWSRIFLKAVVKCDPLLPAIIVDYAASQALPRASTWLQPVMKEVAEVVRRDGLKNVHNVHCSYVEIDKLKSQFDGIEHPQWHPPAK